MDTTEALLYGAVSFAAVVPLVALWRRWLLRRQVLDRPGTRSSHTMPTPTGGGLAVIPVIAVAWLVQSGVHADVAVVVAVVVVLGLVSWLDDLRSLPVGQRLSLHAAAVLIGTWQLWPALGGAFDGLPVPTWLLAGFAAIAWMWFINLYNFMDGIDGIAGIETVAIAVGVGLVAVIADGPQHVLVPAAVVAGAAAGFLVWNWHPAKLFLGDSGSIPLGFLVGWLLLELALAGAWPAALILPLYYLADATITLGRRVVRRQRFWHPHREHFYQRAVQRGLSHAQISSRIAACNLLLVGLAVVSLTYPWAAALAAAAAVSALLRHLYGSRRGITAL